MTSIPTAKAKADFSRMVSRAGKGKERILVTRRGEPVAAVVSVEDLERLEEMENQDDLQAFDKGMESVETEGTVPWEAVKAKLGL